MGLEPGAEFRIEIHQDTGAIWLLPIDAATAGALLAGEADQETAGEVA
jgi:hypothetical protein